MTVSELIKALQEYPGDMTVAVHIGEYEGRDEYEDIDCLYTITFSRGNTEVIIET
jgi:hypothetical protein